jgi:hypothetical protein
METLREAIRQVLEGTDFDPPDKVLGNLTPEQATTKLPGWPYSIATNVAHTDHWQRIWLARLEGTKRRKSFPDFPGVSPEEWPEVRDRFLTNFQRALEIANAEPFVHRMKSNEVAVKILLEIAVHNAYHVGQMKLLKRLLRSSPKD